MAPRILISSIAMGAEYLSYVKFIATEVPTFFRYIISVLAGVHCQSVPFIHGFAANDPISMCISKYFSLVLTKIRTR